MKRKLIFLLNIALLLVTSGVLAQSGTNYDVEWSVMGSAGDQFVSGSSYQMGFTLAPDQASLISSGSNYQIIRGFWSGAGTEPPTGVTLSSFSAKSSAGLEASPVWPWLVGVAALAAGSVLWVRRRLTTRGNSN